MIINNRRCFAAAPLLAALCLSGCYREGALVSSRTPSSFDSLREGSPVSPAYDSSYEKISEQKDETEKPGILTIHVCGAVRNEGVYELAEGSRVYDAVEAAGGFEDDADTLYANLAMPLSDSQQIRIYTVEETSMNGPLLNDASKALEAEASGAADSGQVNINTASLQELMTLPGIGEAKGQAILEHRAGIGAFESIEQLMEISGIKQGLFDRIKDKITV